MPNMRDTIHFPRKSSNDQNDLGTSCNSKKPRFLATRSSEWFIVLVVFVAIFADVFIYGLVVPVLPYSLKTLLKIDAGKIQVWVAVLLSVYGAANVLFSPILGYMADRGNSRRVTFMATLLIMGGSTALFAVAQSRFFLLLARICQGMAAAGIWTVGLAIVVDTVEQRRIGTAMGYMSLAMTSGNVLGPMCGGIIFEEAGYRAVFVTALSLVTIAVALRMIMIEKQWVSKWYQNWLSQDIRPNDHRYDTISNHFTLQGRACNPRSFELASVESADSVEGDSVKPTPQGVARPLSLLASRRFLVVMLGIGVSSAFYSAFDSILPLQTMRLFHWSSTGSGLIFLPLSLPSVLSPVLGRAVDKYGTRVVAFSGFFFSLPPYVAMGYANSNTLTAKILLCVALFIVGACLMAQMVPLMAEVSQVVDRKEDSANGNGNIAMGYAFFNAAYAGGIFLGALLGGLLCEKAGWKTTTLILGLLSATTAIPFWLCKEIGYPKEDDKQAEEDTTDERI